MRLRSFLLPLLGLALGLVPATEAHAGHKAARGKALTPLRVSVRSGDNDVMKPLNRMATFARRSKRDQVVDWNGHDVVLKVGETGGKAFKRFWRDGLKRDEAAREARRLNAF